MISRNLAPGLIFLLLAVGIGTPGIAGAAGSEGEIVPLSPAGADRIVNGVPTSQFPAVVALLDAASGRQFCTGTLVGCRTVLTAAHCVCQTNGSECQPSSSELIDASRLLVFSQHGGFETVSTIRVPEEYVFGTTSDVALLSLGRDVTGIRPVPRNARRSPEPGLTGTIVGFGLTNGTREDTGGLKRRGSIETTTCAEVPEEPHVCWEFDFPSSQPGAISNTCRGDSGGPLFLNFGQGPVLAGVTSGGVSTTCLAPDTAWDADVFFDAPWIEANGGGDLGTTSCGDLPAAGSSDAPIFAVESEISTTVTSRRFTFEVPPGADRLRIGLNGEEGGEVGNDYDLFLRAGVPATATNFDCSSQLEGIYEFCEISSPTAGVWHVLVDRFAGAGPFQLTATVFGGDEIVVEPGDCVADATTLCIDDDPGDARFEIAVDFSTALGGGSSGSGRAIPLASLGIRRGGLFWFFDATNPELLIKVLDGCGVNGHRWVFWSAGTTVGLDVRVTDTVTGVVKTYGNVDGRAAEPVVDVEAFVCE